MQRTVHHPGQKIVSILGSVTLALANSLANPQPSFGLSASAQSSREAHEPPTPNRQPPQVTSRLQTEWHTGFCMTFAITNTGAAPITNWRLQFKLNQAEIHNRWNGIFSRQGNQYTVIPAGGGRNLPAGQRVDLGFCATKRGADFLPTEIAVGVF